MDSRVDHLLAQVLSLPDSERSAVAAALFDSLSGSEDAAIANAWRHELRIRRDNLRSGRVTATPWSEARERLSAL